MAQGRRVCSNGHLSAIVLAAFLQGASGAADAKRPCTNADAVWSHAGSDHQTVFYYFQRPGEGTINTSTAGSLRIEQWRGSKLAWRQNGRWAYSNGNPVLSVTMEANGYGDNQATDRDQNQGEAPEAYAVMETIDANADGLSDWIILAGLNQATYYSGGAKVEWFNGFVPDKDARQILPENIYRFLACKKQ